MSRPMRGPPPGWALRLMEACLPIGVVGESIRGDLEDEYRDISGPDWLAGLWYSYEAIKIAMRYRGGWGMSDLLQDVKYGLRMLKRMPMLTLVAVFSLAAGIAASTAMFAIYYGFLFAPFPFENGGELKSLMQVDRTSASERRISVGNVLDLAEGVAGFEDVAAWRTISTTLTGGEEPVQIRRFDATPNLFEVLGREAALGRTFSIDEGRPGSTDVAVMTHRMWENLFASDREILGRPVEVAGREYTVIGIMPPDFEFLQADVGLVVPNTFEEERDVRVGGAVNAVALLTPSATTEQVQAQADVLWQRLATEHPEALSRFSFRIEGFREQFPGEGDTRMVQVMLIVALFVLVIAAANVANLLLARAEERGQEIAVRVSLGAGRIRLVRQLLTESVMLAMMGGVLGIGLAILAVQQIAGVMPPQLPRAVSPQIQPMVLAFTVMISAGVGIFFGLAPALQALRSNQQGTLSAVSRGGTIGRARRRVRSAFVVGEIAVALALLAGAGAFITMSNGLLNVDLGVRTEGVLTFRTTASGEMYDDLAERSRFHREIEAELLELPQVVGVAVMDELPRGRGVRSSEFTIDGREPQEGQETPVTWLHSVNENYFSTMEVDLRSGRLFESMDGVDAPLVAVVNESLAEFHFPAEEALGRRITIQGESREIIGVVGDVFHTRVAFDGSLAGMVYLPMEQHPIRSVAYAVRTSNEPTELAGSVRPAVWAVEDSAPVNGVQTLDAFIANEMSAIRVIGGIMGLFGVLALVLSAMGIYGVMAHAVSQRRREIGIRMALGAEGSSVIRLVLRNGVIQAFVGILIGTPLAFVIRAASSGMAADFKSTLEGGPQAIALVAAVLALVCLLATYLPARRAAGVHPTTALREDG